MFPTALHKQPSFNPFDSYFAKDASITGRADIILENSRFNNPVSLRNSDEQQPLEDYKCTDGQSLMQPLQ